MESLWEILIPRRDNDGKPFRTRHHREWDKQVRRITGGITVMAPTVKGEWTDVDSRVYTDSTIPVRIACSRTDIEYIMDIAAKHYKQVAMMAYKISEEVIIKNY